jgi:putative membrane protein
LDINTIWIDDSIKTMLETLGLSTLLLAPSNRTIWVWTWEPSILIGIALWTLGYILLVGPVRKRKKFGPPVPWGRQVSFHLGTLVLFIALVSPLDHLSDVYLLSAHMIQHILLILVTPPLWFLGMPNGWLEAYFSPGWLQKIIHWMTRPVTAFLIFNGVFYAWHIPALYDAALYNENLHILEHLMFIGVAIIGWWPMLGFLPKTAPRASYPLQMLYLFLMMVFSTGLGAIITLSKDPLYPFYLTAPPVLGNTPLPAFANAPRLWGMSVMDDQQLAGLIMWVPGNMLFFTTFMIVLFSWFNREEHEELGQPVHPGVESAASDVPLAPNDGVPATSGPTASRNTR